MFGPFRFPDVLAWAFILWFCLYYVYFKCVSSKYWKNRNVFYVEPTFLLGNTWRFLFTENISFVHENRYKQWKDKKLVGYWSFTSPSLLVSDLELIKKILVRDFNHFADRSININEKKDPLAAHLVNLQGSKWRNLRVKLTPTFTSGKMKMMFPIMTACAHQMQKYLSKQAEKEQVLEMREFLARFTTDIIASCAFGIQTNCLENPDSEFRSYGRKIFEPSLFFVSRFLLTSFFPKLRDILGITTIPRDVSNFFLNVVKDTMEFRETKGVKHNDFLDLLIELKNKGSVDSVDSTSGKEEQKFTIEQAAAQAFVFFAAGFETSSTTLSFAFYELAVNPDIQSALQAEIDSSLEKNGGLTYEGIHEMQLLDRVIQETLRKYPPLTILARKCTKEYTIPEMGVSLEKGTRVVISVLGIQKDPQYFPKPEKFDPDRFLPEEKAKRHHMTFLSFGEGPRNCIGNRFGLLQTKVGLIALLSRYNVEVSKETRTPLVFNKRAFILTPEGGIPLKVSKRRHQTFPL